MIDAVLVKNANRMMTVASLLEDGIELGFADGAKGLIPYSDLPEIGERAALSTLELPNPYEMILKTAQGATVEIPWDFARHYCDASYRPAVEAIAMRGRLTLGQRVRRLRNFAGLSQDALARAAGIGRVTLVRLEKGEQTPRYKTLSAVARVLGVDVSELLVDLEVLRQQVVREGRAGCRAPWRGFGLGGLLGHDCGGQVGGGGTVSVRERAGVSLVRGGLGDVDGEPDGARGLCVEAGACAGFCGAVCRARRGCGGGECCGDVGVVCGGGIGVGGGGVTRVRPILWSRHFGHP